MRSVLRVLVTLALAVSLGSSAGAQGAATTTLAGFVRDPAGATVPGAEVTITHDASGAVVRTQTNGRGSFSIPALAAGTYTIRVSAGGFRDAVVKNIVLVAGAPTSATIQLAVSTPSETPAPPPEPVTSVYEPWPAATLKIDTAQLDRLPLLTRDATPLVTLLPGVDTTGLTRASSLLGLPAGALSITLDGANVQEPYRRSASAFFARVTPRPDAIDQVVVVPGTPSAGAAGEGGAGIRFITRSGANQPMGTAYDYYRGAWLNTNTFFNAASGLPRDRTTVNQFGGSQGGPIVIPHLVDGHDKAFFFANLEALRAPSRVTQTRTVLTPAAQTGAFSYTVTTGGVPTVRTVDLLTIAAANGQTSTLDPTVSGLLAKIQAATAAGVTGANGTDPLTRLFRAPASATRRDWQPTVRADVNLAPGQRLSGTYSRVSLRAAPDVANGADAQFPGFLNQATQVSASQAAALSLRSALGSRWVNELRYADSRNTTTFGPGALGNQFADQGGLNLQLPLVSGATAASASSRRHDTGWSIHDELHWFKSQNAVTFGASFTRTSLTTTRQDLVPSVAFGVDPSDPADALFTSGAAGNFPGASSADLENARALYAMLTGRVTAIRGTAGVDPATGQYTYLGPSSHRGRLDEGGLFAQDDWRLGPGITLTAGLRWQAQGPFVATDNSFSTANLSDICGLSGILTGGTFGRDCQLFTPGSFTGVSPMFSALPAGRGAYGTDRNNVAPNAGFAWHPNARSGWERVLLGDPDRATLRAGLAWSYDRFGVGDFFDVLDVNPGASVRVDRTASIGNLFAAPAPLLLRTAGSVAAPAACAGSLVPPACTPATLTYPLAAVNQPVSIFDRNIQIPQTRTYTGSFERSVGPKATMDIRYVRARTRDGWSTENWNELNLFESGFIDEFRLAQANLSANLANGRGPTFQYFGEASGTAPLPTYLAFAAGTPKSAAGDPASYTGAFWTDPTYISRLSVFNPNPITALNDLWGNAAQRANLQTAGVPVNQFILNPDLGTGGAFITRSGDITKYEAIEVDVRRPLSRGLTFAAGYTYASRWTSTYDSIRFDRYLIRSSMSVPNAFKLDWTYEIPVGRGRRHGAALSPWLDGLVGGWSWSGTGRVQSGQLMTLSGVRLVNMTQDELQRAFRPRVAADQTVTMLPDDVILNTRRAFSTDPLSATGYSALGAPTGRYLAPASTGPCFSIYPGDCGEARHLYVRGPIATNFDFSFRKGFALGGRRSVQVELDLFNVFNATNFTPVFQVGSSASLYQVTSVARDPGSLNPGGRVGQIMWRLRW